MKKIIYEILTNRLGNALAIGNFVLIAINASGFTAWLGLNAWTRFSFLINLPARIASVVILGNSFLLDGPWKSRFLYYTFGTLLFAYLQWIGIGWIAGKISRAIQPQQTKLP
jgi:hypothetical protein